MTTRSVSGAWSTGSRHGTPCKPPCPSRPSPGAWSTWTSAAGGCPTCEPIRAAARARPGLQIQRAPRAQVHHLGGQSVGCERVGGGQRVGHPLADRNDREIVAASRYPCLSERDDLVVLCRGSLDRVQPLVL